MVEVMNPTAVEEIELNIKQAQKIVDAGTSLERLMLNRDFKKVFIEGYLEQEAIRLVHLKSDESMQTPAKQESVIKQIDAIGAVSSYLNTVRWKAAQAVKAIDADEQTREELLTEDVE